MNTEGLSRRKVLSNQLGFTLLESLLALFISSLVLLMVSALFNHLYFFQKQEQESKNMEWHLFLNQVEHDLQDKELLIRTRQFVEFQEKGTGRKVAYEWKKQEIVWKKDGQGYAPLLTGIKEVLYQDAPGGIFIQVSFGNGQVMKGYVPVEKKK